jgi:ferrous iron transport protein A
MSSAPSLDPALMLADLPVANSAVVRAVTLEPGEIDWLHAIGIGVGQRVTVLRRGALGGPLHVRTDSGGEFAIDRALARAIAVERGGGRSEP